MARTVLIIGESGTGKSASLRNLNADCTAILKCTDKELPFKGAKNFPQSVVTNWNDCANALRTISGKEKYKYCIVDDLQYLLVGEFVANAAVTGYNKYTVMAKNYWDMVNFAKNLRPDLTVFFLSHSQTSESGKSKVKTIGNMLDNHITIEGLFTIVLNTFINDGRYVFQTQNNGNNTTKSPMGMFSDFEIDNDLNLVADTINNYYK